MISPKLRVAMTVMLVLCASTCCVGSLDQSQTEISALGVRPWQDTTDGIYVFNDQMSSNMGADLCRFAATHYAGCQKMVRSDADALRSYNSNFLILHYRLGLGLGYREADAEGHPTGDYLYIIEGDDWVREWPSTVQDQWFYPYGGSSRVYQLWGWYLIEPDNASWRTYWIGEILRQLSANADDGLFADSTSVPNYLGGESFDPNLPDYDPTFESEWSSKIERWITYVRGQLTSNYKLIPNVGAWITSRDQTDYSGADGVMIEGFSAWDEWDYFDVADWQLQMDRILSLVNLNKIVICQSYVNDVDDTSYRVFLLASHLLVKGSRTYLNMEVGYEPEWFPEYSVDLGAPVGGIPAQISDLYRSDWEVYVREYENGLVIVNPDSTSRSFDVGSGYAEMVPHGGGIVPENGDISTMYLTYEPVDAVVMPAHTGLVLLRSGPTPGVLSVTPDTGLSSVGLEGGPFAPSSKQYTLTNVGGSALNWTASHGSGIAWVSLSSTSGTLSSGGSTTVTVSINSSATSLTAGTYTDTVQFANASGGGGNTSRSVSLLVQSGRLAVSPSSGLSSSGKVGGPFSPSSLTYTLSNPGNSTINYGASHNSGVNWVTLSKTSGTLVAGGSTTMTVSINSNANSLPIGSYGDTVSFVNTTNGMGDTTRSVSLTVTSGTSKLQVVPPEGFASAGPRGGPFSPGSKRYTLTNIGTASINWSVTCDPSSTWLAISPRSGTLARGASITVQLAISSYARSLTGGTYTDTVYFKDVTNGGTTTRSAALTVTGSGGSLSVSPSSGLASSGSVGGPFSPSSIIYTLSNPGNSSINWTASHLVGVNWVTLSSTSGTLSSGGSTTMTVSINSNANSLPAGTYSDTLSFTNTTNGQGNTTRSVALTVGGSGGVLSVVPSDGFTSYGPKGGGFTPGSKRYTLANTGTASINWTVTCTPSSTWLAISPRSGTLASGASIVVQLAISKYANFLAKGTYTDTVSFTNTTNGRGNTTRPVRLTVY